MSTKRTIGVGATIGLLLVAILWLVLSPYLTVNRLQAALDAKDPKKMSQFVDYDSLRTNIKFQASTEITRRGSQAGQSQEKIEQKNKVIGAFIDAIVQPDLIIVLMSDKKSAKPLIGDRFSGDVHIRRTGLTRFILKGKNPGAAVFEMKGLAWKLVGFDPTL